MELTAIRRPFLYFPLRHHFEQSLPVEIPDLRRPDARRAYAADDWFPELPEL